MSSGGSGATCGSSVAESSGAQGNSGAAPGKMVAMEFDVVDDEIDNNYSNDESLAEDKDDDEEVVKEDEDPPEDENLRQA
jgi:hypothetical protein